jgi:hypothetical protein
MLVAIGNAESLRKLNDLAGGRDAAESIVSK